MTVVLIPVNLVTVSIPLLGPRVQVLTCRDQYDTVAIVICPLNFSRTRAMVKLATDNTDSSGSSSTSPHFVHRKYGGKGTC